MQHRFSSLDGLRGLASTIVVVRHTFNAVAMPTPLREALLASPLALVLNAQGAVQLFFVLSGFVLAGSVSRAHGWRGHLAFLAKRFLRIHPPYVVAVLGAWLASFAYVPRGPGLGMTGWMRGYLSTHIDAPTLLRSLWFPGTAGGQLPVGWTLEIELIYSLLLPVLFLAARRFRWWVLLAAVCMLTLDGGFRLTWYALDFILGMGLWLERERIRRTFGAGGSAAVAGWVVVLLSLVLFSAPLLFSWGTATRGIVVQGFDPLSIGVMGLGAAGLVGVAPHVAALKRALCVRPVLFLGRISFSLYLIHKTVLFLCGPLVPAELSLLGGLSLLGVVMLVSIVLSVPYERWIERPCVEAGRRLTARVARE